MGRTLEIAWGRARASHGLRDASIRGKGDEGWDLDGKQEVCQGQQRGPVKPTKHIMYLDANNLYGWAMIKPLPKRDFKRKRVMPTEEEILKKKRKRKERVDSRGGSRIFS